MPRPILGGGIDVGLEHRRRAALQIIGEILAALLIEPVRQPMRLHRVKALEVKQRIDEARGRGIAIVDRDQIGAERVAEIGFVAQRFVIGLADQVARQRRMIEPLGDPMDHRIFKPVVMQHGRIDEGSQFGLAADDVLGLAPDAVPDRVERGELRTLRIDLMHCHDCSRKFACLVDIIARRADGCPGQAQAKVNPRQMPRGQFKVVRDFRKSSHCARLLVNFCGPTLGSPKWSNLVEPG